MGTVRVPTVRTKRKKQYRIVTKPTTEAFCRGARCTTKKVSEEWLKAELLKLNNDTDVETYFYEEIKEA